MKSRKTSGFTLIELLVVIAIIAILAAILFPVFTMAKKTAQKTACLNNCKQMGLGLMLYTENNNDTWPDPCIIGATRHGDWDKNESYSVTFYSYTLQDLLLPYTKNKGVRYCPSDIKNKATEGPSSYIFRHAVDMFAIFLGPIKTSTFGHPSKIFVLFERNDFHGKNLGFWTHPAGRREFNAVFADGHSLYYTKPLCDPAPPGAKGSDPSYFKVRNSPYPTTSGYDVRYDYDL